MSKKIFYIYNPSTEQFERVYPSRRSRILTAAGHFCVSILLGSIFFFVLNGVVDLPKERVLRADNKELHAQLDVLSARLDEALEVMNDIAQRDNNFYRVMMQADRITDAQRYAGIQQRTRFDRLSSMPDNELVENLTDKLTLLEKSIVVQSRSFDRLRQLALEGKDRMDHIPAIQPISEKFLKTMASGYGTRVDPIYRTARFHEGMDFSADIGTPVYATADGTVALAQWHSGYGNLVEVNHGYNYVTRYAHLSKYTVSAGQKVKRGDLVGYVGNTGKSTGPHLHYEVRLNGAPQNPVNYYFYDLTPEEYAAMIEAAENAGHVMD
jgi:murein DD-endopeptidase MepM/ murein hydrolase activator NlpD